MKLLFSIIFLIFSINLIFSMDENVVLTPYLDSDCTEFGGGVGYGYLPAVEYSNIIRVFGNLYDSFKFEQSTNGQTLLMDVLGSNGRIMKSETFNLKKCQFSEFLKAYYLYDVNIDLPKPSVQINQWGNGWDGSSYNGECEVDMYQSFNFVANGTIINSYSQSTQQFYCENNSPYLKTCPENSSCYTNQTSSCFDGEYKATCIN
ncbi:hypothetical protein ACTA71_002686 [Dictyostelium dimigraforme]